MVVVRPTESPTPMMVVVQNQLMSDRRDSKLKEVILYPYFLSKIKYLSNLPD